RDLGPGPAPGLGRAPRAGPGRRRGAERLPPDPGRGPALRRPRAGAATEGRTDPRALRRTRTRRADDSAAARHGLPLRLRPPVPPPLRHGVRRLRGRAARRLDRPRGRPRRPDRSWASHRRADRLAPAVRGAPDPPRGYTPAAVDPDARPSDRDR